MRTKIPRVRRTGRYVPTTWVQFTNLESENRRIGFPFRRVIKSERRRCVAFMLIMMRVAIA